MTQNDDFAAKLVSILPDDMVIEIVESELRKCIDDANYRSGVYWEIIGDLLAVEAKRAIEDHRNLIPDNEWDADDDLLVAAYERVINDNTVSR